MNIKKFFSYAIWLVPIALWMECCLRPMAEPDLFFYYALVEKYLSTGQWPVNDPFLYTLPTDYLMSLHQWLGYWIYYLPYLAFGWAGPILLKTVVVAIFICIPMLPFWLKRRTLPFYFPVLWTLAIFVAHHRFRERVSLFGDFIILLLVCGLLWCRERRWFWYGLPVMFLLWAQLHPSFPLGWVILLMFFATQRPVNWERHMLVSAGLCLLTPLLNPLGFAGTAYPFTFSMNVEPYLRQYVVEWLPLTDSRLFEFKFLYVPFVTVVPFLLCRLWTQRHETRLFEWLLLVLATALTLKSVRFGLMAQGIFLTLITNAELRRPLAVRVAPWVYAVRTAVAVAIAGVKISLSSRLHIAMAQRFHIDNGYFPEQSVDDLDKMAPKLRIFNSFGYGGYLAWRWEGNPPIFFHGFSTNFKFYEDNYNRPQEGQKELDELIKKYDIGVFLLSKLGNDNNFINILAQHAGWQKIREDGAAVIFAKRDVRVFQ